MRPNRQTLALLATLLMVAACAPVPPALTASPSPSTGAGVSAAPSAAASASPTAASAAPSAAPSQAPSAAPAAFDMTDGKLLRKYDFQGATGIHYDFSRDQFWIIDGEDEESSPRRYLARRFSWNGAFDAAIDLHKVGEQAPEAVSGFAFDLSGVPAFTYQVDDNRSVHRPFSLRRLYTATVTDAERLPSTALERSGLATLAAQENTFSLGVVRFDPDVSDEFDTRKREILYVRAEEEQDPEAIFRIPDPMEPTSRMAMSPDGMLYLFGGIPGAGLKVKRLDETQAIVDLPIPLSRMPDEVWLAPNGDLLLLDETTGNAPARIRRFSPAGTLVAETEVRLADGQVVFDVNGLAFDSRNRITIVGSAIARDLAITTGLFTFD